MHATEVAMNIEKLKIAVLYDVWEDAEVEETPRPAPRKRKGQKKQRKEKHDREEIFEALEKLGHEPSYQVVDGRTQSLISLARCGADLVFNLTESYAGDDTKDMNITAYLDLLGLPYTGSGPHGHFLAQDKAIFRGRRIILVIPMGDVDASTARHTVGMFTDALAYVEADLVATVLAPNVNDRGEVAGHADVMAAARQAGRQAVKVPARQAGSGP